MCVAICCPKGVNTPSLETLKKCWDHNSHGAGFAFNDPHTNRVVFHKGFMKWDDFVHAFQKTCKVDKMTDNVRFIHFRITSKGETCPENTHPFPISTASSDLKILDGSCEEIMFHNGTFSSIDISEKGISDTMEMAMWVARLQLTSQGLDALCKFLTPLISGNKLGFLNGKGEHALAGSWSQVDGVYYSNTYWNTTYSYATKSNTTTYSYPSHCYRGYQWDDDYSYDYENWYYKNKKKDKEDVKTSAVATKTTTGTTSSGLKKHGLILDDKRVYNIITDAADIIDLIDGYCPEPGCNKANAIFMGSDDLYKNEDPIFYCPDCDKYYVIHQSGMSSQEKTDFFDYVYDYFGFEGTVLEFIQAFFEGDVPDAEETSDEETVDVKVKEEKKDGIAEEVIESDGKVSIQIPTSKVLKGIVNKIKSKVCSK